MTSSISFEGFVTVSERKSMICMNENLNVTNLGYIIQKTSKNEFLPNKKTISPHVRKDGLYLNEERIPAINACGNLRQKLSISYGPCDDVQPILYVRF